MVILHGLQTPPTAVYFSVSGEKRHKLKLWKLHLVARLVKNADLFNHYKLQLEG